MACSTLSRLRFDLKKAPMKFSAAAHGVPPTTKWASDPTACTGPRGLFDLHLLHLRPKVAADPGHRSGRLDKALVITGFTGALTLTDGAVAEFGQNVLAGGVPLPR